MVREISDEFLLNLGGMSATLVGLFLVGMFFYAETALRQPAGVRSPIAPYIRASARIVLILYSIPIGVSLSLVALELVWSRLLFVVLSVLLVAANLDTVRRLLSLNRPSALPSVVVTEVIGTATVVVLVSLPWLLGGLTPNRSDLTWSLLIAFATGFLSIGAMVLIAFDMAASNQSGTDESAPDRAIHMRTDEIDATAGSASVEESVGRPPKAHRE